MSRNRSKEGKEYVSTNKHLLYHSTGIKRFRKWEHVNNSTSLLNFKLFSEINEHKI